MQHPYPAELRPDPLPTLKIAAFWVGLTAVAIIVPYLFGWSITPQGKVFTWALLNPDDVGVYVSAMRQGAAGNWLYHFTYSPEPWQPRFMLSLYLIAGKIFGLFSSPTVISFHILRLICSGITIWAFWFWSKTIFPEQKRWQWTNWLLLLFGGGFGWLFLMIFPESPYPPDLGLAEWSPLISMFNAPHFALGFGLQTLFFAGIFRMLSPNEPRPFWWAICSALVGVFDVMSYVYHLAVIGLVIGTLMLILAGQARALPRRSWTMGAIVLAPLLPLLFYYALYTGNDPYWIEYTQQTHVIPPPALRLAVVGLGGMGILALIGGVYWIKMGRTPLLPAWAIVHILILYAPGVAYSGRFALGLLVPIAALAIAGLEGALLPALSRRPFFGSFSRLTPTPYATLRRVLLMTLSISTILALASYIQGPYQIDEFPYYLPAPDIEAATWLGSHAGADSLILADYPMGNYFPRVYAGKLFMGQLDFTTNLPQKERLFIDFWSGAMSEEERQNFLAEWGITHLFVGNSEQLWLGENVQPIGELIYQNEGQVSIYQIDAQP